MARRLEAIENPVDIDMDEKNQKNDLSLRVYASLDDLFRS